MSKVKLFPVLEAYGTHSRGEIIDRAQREGLMLLVLNVPWDMIASHEAQAMANHGGQSLERLAQRGGLDVNEVLAVLTSKTDAMNMPYMSYAESHRKLFELIQQWSLAGAEKLLHECMADVDAMATDVSYHPDASSAPLPDNGRVDIDHYADQFMGTDDVIIIDAEPDAEDGQP